MTRERFHPARLAIAGATLFVATATHLIAQTVSAAADLPPGFPREGATRVLDNAWATAWEATWAPNKPTAMHRHPFDYVGVELADATFRVTSPGGQPRASSRARGDSWFLARGTTHMEEGLSDPGRHAIVIDLKDSTPPVFANTTAYPTVFPATASAATKRVENARVAMYAYTIRDDGGTYFYDRNALLIMVDSGTVATTTSDGRLETRAVVPGQVVFRPGGGAWADRATKGPVRVIVVLLKGK